MKYAGASITASEITLVTIEKTGAGGIMIVPMACTKISLERKADQDDVKSLFQVLSGFVLGHQISQIAIRGRQEKGPFAGGAASFKIEGVVQLLPEVDVTVIASTTVTAWEKKNASKIPTPKYQYQKSALGTACCLAAKAK